MMTSLSDAMSAAAPDLLAASKRALGFIRYLEFRECVNGCWADDLMADLEKAIHKAEGGA